MFAPLAAAMEMGLSEGAVGIWLGRFGQALRQHYGPTDAQAAYFREHFEADTQQHGDGIIPHGQSYAYLLRKLLEDGYQPEQPGFDLEYSVDLGVDLYVSFLNGVVERF